MVNLSEEHLRRVGIQIARNPRTLGRLNKENVVQNMRDFMDEVPLTTDQRDKLEVYFQFLEGNYHNLIKRIL